MVADAREPMSDVANGERRLVEVKNPMKIYYRRRFHREQFWDPEKRKRSAETVTVKFSQTLVDSVDSLFYGMWEAEQYWSM